MFGQWFKKDKPSNDRDKKIPSVLGLRPGASFELDPLMVKLYSQQWMTENMALGYVISAVGVVVLDDTHLLRFYTDDDAFLQVVTQGGMSDENVIDVKLFHYFDTQDVSSEQAWQKLLNEEIGSPDYTLQNTSYQRVWDSVTHYHQPVPMREQTFDAQGHCEYTDQFTMLFERDIAKEQTESLFLSAEEKATPHGTLERCFVRSTGISLSPSQLHIHG